MKIKHTLMAIVSGQLIVFVGAFIKINHYPSSRIFLSVGLAVMIGGGFAFLYKLSKHPKVKEFLNF